MLYTDEEKQWLLDSLDLNLGNPEEAPEVRIRYKDEIYYIDLSVIYTILCEDTLTGLESTCPAITNEIEYLMLKEPIENMPLHINVIPEIARWRLKVGR